MPLTSPALGLPYIAAAQAQKHVTHNEALRVLDAAVQLVVLGADLATPPGGASDGDRYIVASPATDDWEGQENSIAVRADDTWHFFTPTVGWRADLAPTGATLRFDGTTWQDATQIDTLPELGINASADTVNRLSVASEATLLSHDGAGHQLKLNKAAATDTASLLFQTGFSGRAEMGITGSDEFAIKVSPDGTQFNDVLVTHAGTGAMQLPAGQLFFRDVFIVNDTVHSFDIPFSNPARILMWMAINITGYHFLFSITGSLSGASNFVEMFTNPPGKISFSTGALTGTTGPASSINLSIDASGAQPRMFVENRIGSNRLFTLATLGK